MPTPTLTEVFTDIADAIRAKTGSADTMTPTEMADEIAAIPSGPDLPFSVVSMVKMSPDGELHGYTSNEGWYHYTMGSDQSWASDPLNGGSTYWFDPMNSDDADPLSPGEIYYIGTQGSEAPAQIILTTDSVYTYRGGHEFESYDAPAPSDNGWYEYDTSSGWYLENGITDDGLYQINILGHECTEINVYDTSDQPTSLTDGHLYTYYASGSLYELALNEQFFLDHAGQYLPDGMYSAESGMFSSLGWGIFAYGDTVSDHVIMTNDQIDEFEINQEITFTYNRSDNTEITLKLIRTA